MLRGFRLIFLLTLGPGAGPSAVGVLIGQAPAAPAPPNSEWRTYGAELAQHALPASGSDYP